MTEFEKIKAIFLDAIDRQIDIIQEPKNPVWEIIRLKQCCGLNFQYSKEKSVDYQWFERTIYLYFCPEFYLKNDQSIKFKQKFETNYSPQGPCLPLVTNELKIELILISISFGFSILLMLLTWLFIWQDRLLYLALLKDILEEQNKNSIIDTNKSSIVSITNQTDKTDIEDISIVDKLSQVNVKKSSETKQFYQGYLSGLRDLE